MQYKFKQAPWATYQASIIKGKFYLVCLFHIVILTQDELNFLLAVGKLDRVIN